MKRIKLRFLLIIIFSFLLGGGHLTAVSATTQGDQLTYLPYITKPIQTTTLGSNLFPNPSFELGWYHPNGIPELQIPNNWTFSWDEGPTGYGNELWDIWVRPEVRVLPSDQLPDHEHPLFIWDGDQTLKIFKGWGAISFRLTTPVNLEPGNYQMTINFYPDLVVGYDNGNKIYASDPASGEVAFIVDGAQTEWQFPTFGEQNELIHTFTLSQSGTTTIGVAMRGRYAIQNNGWFMDAWSLQKIEPAQ